MQGARADTVEPAESNSSAEDTGAPDDSKLEYDLEDFPHRIRSDPLPSNPFSFPAEGHHHSDDTPRSTAGLISPRHRQLAATHDSDNAVSNRTSMSHWDPEPGFAHVDGEIGGSGYNETLVDIVTVPCPGADPVETWTRDPLPDGFFGNPNDNELTIHSALKELAGDAILTPGIGGNFPKAAHLWVRQGIRRYANTARVLLYRHRELADNTTLDGLARDLLDNVLQRREGQHVSRPVFFIAHSIGGLVVKQALLIARRDETYRGILFNCHGVTFFATPHRGSSYMAMRHLSESIQLLLHLQRPLPRTLAHDVRVGNKNLLKMHDDFTDIASEMRLWTFYETIDSELSGSGSGLANEVQFSAPLVSIKSAIVGVRQEMIYSSLESDHAHCASFGITNPRTMSTYLHDLADAVAKAVTLSQTIHTPLWLKDEVKIELIGFYEDPDATDLDSDVRLYFTRYHLSEFLKKGPERCLEERLKCVPRRHGAPGHKDSAQAVAGRASSGGGGGLNIVNNVQKILTAAVSGSHEQGRPSSPDIVVTLPSARPTMVEGHDLAEPTGRRPHSLTLPALSNPGFHRPSSRGSGGTTSTMSDPTDRDISPKEGASATHRETWSHDHPARANSEKAGLRAASKLRAERLSRTAALQDLTAGFSRPNPARRKFMWMHLPFTNPLWVKDIFDKLSETHNQNFNKLFNNENWVSRHVHGRHSQSQPSFVKPAVHFISPDSAPSPRPAHSSPNLSNGGPPTTYLYLYLPYLHFDTYRQIIKRRNIVTRRLAHGRARPVPEDIANLESLELRMIWDYLGYDPPLNCRRTLDQYGYPSLRDTYTRDDDQMLYKLTKEGKPQRLSSALTTREEESIQSLAERYSLGTKLLHQVIEREKEMASSDSENEVEAEVRDGNLLMVDQLWLWAIDTTTLTTFFPKRESRPAEGALFQQADLRNSVYNELNGDLTGRCENALDLAAFVALHAVTVLLDRSSHPDLEVFRIFEEAIGMLTERMTWNLKKFRMQTFKDFELESEDEDPEDNTAKSIKKRHKREIERAERENRENTSALLELRDMEDELKTLSKLFDTQTAMLGKMLDIYQGDSLKDLTHYGQGYLQEALGRLEEYKLQTTEMLDRVAATKGDYEKLLEMAQRQAQVDDVRWSRLQTELASSQNLSVMIFTIFTVIFLPLSFFTSLFGMNTVEWDRQLPTMAFVGEISLPISVVMILATLVAAFSSHVQIFFGTAWRRAVRAWDALVEALRRLEPEAWRRDKERLRAERAREEREERETRRKDRSYDFWATVRRQRTMASYEIPDVNRKRAGTGFDSSGGGGGGGGSAGGTKRSTWRFGSTK
ncbi:Protein SERAC1 [Cytospora mali]|uniref:Protein SERAC1 n=1 Tax=Cytospora mali TaxID=578113 RepID=A0A194UP33_CYTMA|nr:Protein SERAC1 [Valsa mali var. pyri (nom. inval.)]